MYGWDVGGWGAWMACQRRSFVDDDRYDADHREKSKGKQGEKWINRPNLVRYDDVFDRSFTTIFREKPIYAIPG